MKEVLLRTKYGQLRKRMTKKESKKSRMALELWR